MKKLLATHYSLLTILKRLLTTHYSLLTSKGFTVVELLVVAAILATLSVALVLNFRIGARTATARLQTASAIVSDIRRAQSMALAGRQYQNNVVCGYGVRYVSNVSYRIYAKPPPAGGCGALTNHNFEAGDFDAVTGTRGMVNSNMEMRGAFSDVFFKPPDPRVYVGNVTLPTSAMTAITIQTLNQTNCSGGSCTKVEVYNSGQIDLK